MLFGHAVHAPFQVPHKDIDHGLNERFKFRHSRPRRDHHYYWYRQGTQILLIFDTSIDSYRGIELLGRCQPQEVSVRCTSPAHALYGTHLEFAGKAQREGARHRFVKQQLH